MVHSTPSAPQPAKGTIEGKAMPTKNTVNIDGRIETVAERIIEVYSEASRVRLAFLLVESGKGFRQFAEGTFEHDETTSGNRSADNDHLIRFSDGSFAHINNAGCDLYFDAESLRQACDGCDWEACDQDSALTIYGKQEGWDAE